MKTIDEIYEAMLTTFEAETGYDMEASADLAVRLKTAAAQLYSLYVYSDWIGRMAFPQTAEGAYLDRHGEMRGLSRRAAAKAVGTVRFYISAALAYDLPIPAGTVCRTAGLVDFVTTHAGAIQAGALYTDVPAEASLSGTAGNVRSGVVVIMPLPPAGVQGCTNPAAFTGGVDGESDSELRARVLDSFKRLPNGANAAYYENLVLEDSGVRSVKVIPRYNGVGTVGVVVAPAEGVDGAALVTRLQAVLDVNREIAVNVTVMQPEAVTVDMAAALTVSEGRSYADVAAAVRTAVEAYFDDTLIGRDFLKKDIYGILNGVEGLENYAVTMPASDVQVEQGQMAVMGNLTLTEA